MNKLPLLLAVLLSACATTPAHVPRLATKPVIVEQTTVRYVRISPELTAPVPGTSIKLVRGSGVTCGKALTAAQENGRGLNRANAKLAQIATVQGSGAAGGPPAGPRAGAGGPGLAGLGWGLGWQAGPRQGPYRPRQGPVAGGAARVVAAPSPGGPVGPARGLAGPARLGPGPGG